jgi:hypothetical protein
MKNSRGLCMIRLFDKRLSQCALHACTTRRDKPYFVTGREQTSNRHRSQVVVGAA